MPTLYLRKACVWVPACMQSPAAPPRTSAPGGARAGISHSLESRGADTATLLFPFSPAAGLRAEGPVIVAASAWAHSLAQWNVSPVVWRLGGQTKAEGEVSIDWGGAAVGGGSLDCLTSVSTHVSPCPVLPLVTLHLPMAPVFAGLGLP